MPSDGGLGAALVGEKVMINHRHCAVTKLLGEGGFSYVYLVKDISDTAGAGSLNNTVHGEHKGKDLGGAKSSGDGSANNGTRRASGGSGEKEKREMVLKVTSVLNRQQRDIAEKEAKLLSRLSHPSIIKMYDTCYRTATTESSKSTFRSKGDDSKKERPQHFILMEFCEGGHALDVCNKMASKGERFDLSTLIIAFGQICNAVSYLHAQRPPIVHRDLKPANFLVKNGAYKLCDFGSAVFGHVDLKTSQARADAEEVIQKTTTQMFRAPEMVDLYSAKKLTQATDVWALGCCLFSLAFLQNCFEEGSNLAILSRKYKIPDDNPYGDGLVELIDRMLNMNMKERADMTEVILCLSAVYSGRPLPPRKERKSSKKEEEIKKDSNSGGDKEKDKEKKSSSKKKTAEQSGTFRTGPTYEDLTLPKDAVFAKPVKAIDPNSALARRRRAAQAEGTATATDAGTFTAAFDTKFEAGPSDFGAFPDSSGAPATETISDGVDIFGSFDADAGAGKKEDVSGAFGKAADDWGDNSGGKFDDFASFSPEADGAQMTSGNSERQLGDDNDDDPDDDDEEGDNEDDNGDGKGRRKSTSRRRANSGANVQAEMEDAKRAEREAEGGERKRPPRRQRSNSRRQERTSSKEDDLNDLADDMDDMQVDDDDDDNEEGKEEKSKGTSKRRSHKRDSTKSTSTGTRSRRHEKTEEPRSKSDSRRSGSRDGDPKRPSSRHKRDDSYLREDD